MTETPEGIETDLALQFYSRQRLLTNLLPLMSQSTSPRVISILLAGAEGPLTITDLECRDNYNLMRATSSAATMTDLMFEELANSHPTISFIHVNPGFVGTHLLDKTLAAVKGVLWLPAQIPRFTILPVYNHLLATSPDVVGERLLFLATSCRYPPAADHELKGHVDGLAERPAGMPFARSTVMKEGRGNGVYRIGSNCEVCKESEVLEKHREEDVAKVVVDHVKGIWERALLRGQNGN